MDARHGCGRRGAALILALILSLGLASVVLYSFSNTADATATNRREDNYAAALAAARYGAELAISETVNGLILADSSGRIIPNSVADDTAIVVGDWVLGKDLGESTLYRTAAGTSADQRRIRGIFNEHEFVVRVRSARLAYENGNVGAGKSLPEGWLKYPGKFEYGTDTLGSFRDLYEITATARHIDVGAEKAKAADASQPVVQTLVYLGDSVASKSEGLPAYIGALHLEHASGVHKYNGAVQVRDFRIPATPTNPMSLTDAVNIHISGEDHAMNATAIPVGTGVYQDAPPRLTPGAPAFLGAVGELWDEGRLSAHFRTLSLRYPNDAKKKGKNPAYGRMNDYDIVPNPLQPYTAAVGGSDKERALYVPSTDISPDLYLQLGGKSGGRSFTYNSEEFAFDADGVERTSPGRITAIYAPQGEMDQGLAFDSVESLFNLFYVNVVPDPTVASRADGGKWGQVSPALHSYYPKESDVSPESVPILAGMMRRPYSLNAVYNPRGQILVREYAHTFKGASEPVYFSYPASGTEIWYEDQAGNPSLEETPTHQTRMEDEWEAEWLGGYTWVKADYDGKKFTIAEPGKPLVVSGDMTVDVVREGALCVPRVFFHQELLGKSVEKEYSTYCGKGYDPDYYDYQYGFPRGGGGQYGALLGSDGSRTYYANPVTIDVNPNTGEPRPVGFDEAYQRNPIYLANPERKKPHFPAQKLWEEMEYPHYLVDANDEIWARDPETGARSVYRSMDDFRFEKEFRNASGEEITRSALHLFIGMSCRADSDANFNYADLMLNVYIAPDTNPKSSGYSARLLTGNFDWWQLSEEEGLTGGVSRPAITVNMDYDWYDPLTWDDKTDEEMAVDHKGIIDEMTNSTWVESIYTMRETASGKTTDFAKAYFVYEDGRNTGVLDVNHPSVKGKIALGVDTFYCTKLDALTYIAHRMRTDPDSRETWFDASSMEWNFDKALEEISGLVPGGLSVHLAEDRWDDPERYFSTARRGNGAVPDALVALRRNQMVFARSLAAEIVGYSTASLPTSFSFAGGLFDPRSLPASIIGTVPGSEEEALALAIKSESVGFLPGEALVRSVDDNDPLQGAVIVTEDENGELPVAGGREDDLAFPELLEDGSYRKDTVKALIFENPEDAVAACYRDYYEDDPASRERVLALYGPGDKRYSLGFHRGGVNSAELRDAYRQDHYEIAILGKAGFMPYGQSTAASYLGLNPDAFVIARELPGVRDNADFSYLLTEYDYNYNWHVMPPLHDGVPNFVFDKPFEGAGALVVNGNLVIRDDFTYYGTLIVLGDLILERTTVTENATNVNGDVVDAYGNAIDQDASGEWYYVWEGVHSVTGEKYGPMISHFILDEDGNKVLGGDSKPVPVTPIEVTYERGGLTVQGNLVVKGKIPHASWNSSNGLLHVFWSREATERISRIWAKPTTRKVLKRYGWTHNDNLDVRNMWAGMLD